MPKIRKIVLLMKTQRRSARGMMRGFAQYSRFHGPWAFHCEPAWDTMTIGRLKKLIAPVDGICMEDSKFTPEIVKMPLPVILSTADIDQAAGLNYITADNAKAGQLAAEHLLKRGFRRFGFTGHGNLFWSMERCESFTQTISKAGFKILSYDSVQKRNINWEKELVNLAQWVKSLPKPIGLMACNDDWGQNTIEACNIAGVHVPEEVAVIGVDNDDLVCDLVNPPLTSVAVNFESAGYEAAEMLDKMMAGKKITGQRIDAKVTHVVERRSTDVFAVEDEAVAFAMRYVRQHSREPVQVNEVAQAAAVSRRALERRFRAVLGCSVHDEIRRLRTEQIARMLIETNNSILRIAMILGFNSVANISRYFREEKGMTPRAFRKTFGPK